MTLETFFEKIELFAGAPNAVARMRELVLEFAVQGKLVEQDRADEPAAELLAATIEQRQREVAEDGARAKQPLPPISPDEVPYDLPPGWTWERLGNVGYTNIGLTYSPQDIGQDGVPVLRSSNIQNGKIDWSDLVRVDVKPKRSVMVEVGDLLICARNGSRALVGKTALIEHLSEPTAFGAFMAIFRSSLNEYLYHFICSPLFRRVIAEVNTTTINQITQANLRATLAPIPPFAEQKRIVAKVDELMALCDRLEAQQQERKSWHAVLARASLARFADAPTPANLNFLFHSSYTISPADLRKSILTLAVQGQLVAQDPRDEPAEVLNTKLPVQLRAIAKKVGARYSVSATLVEGSDDLPVGWGTAALQSIGIAQTGTTPSKTESAFTGRDIPFIKPGDIHGDRIDYQNEGLSAAGLTAGRLIPKNSVLMVSIGGSIGKTAIVDRDVSCNQQINSITPAECIEPRFALMAIRSSDFQHEVMKRAAQGTLPIISKGKWEMIRIPIPPLAEQRRIVAKVDQLMALVDQLEAQLKASDATAAKLLEAVVGELTVV